MLLGGIIGCFILIKKPWTIPQNKTMDAAGYFCKSHSDCPLYTTKDCGGELCTPQFIPFCSSGKCRRPNNNNEWEESCGGRGWDKIACFEDLVVSVREEKEINVAFDICNRNFQTPDEAEHCRLIACGFYPTNPNISPGEASCVAQALSSTCDDERKNGRETGIDCGGLDCLPCSMGERCDEHSDCQSGVCGVHGIKNQDICYSICPNGLVSDNEPCGCFQKATPQGRVNETPIPLDEDVGSAKSWEEKYGNGKRVYCCDGFSYYLMLGSDCSSVK